MERKQKDKNIIEDKQKTFKRSAYWAERENK